MDKQNRQYGLRYRRIDHFIKWNEDEFYNKFRLSKPTVSFVLAQIETHLQTVQTRTNGNLTTPAISTINKLLLTLRFFGSADIDISIAEFVGIDKSTAEQIIKQVAGAICKLFQRYIHLPQTEDEKVAAKRDFYNISGFPRVIGAMDCTPIKIQSPGGENAFRYFNRKGDYCLNCQIVSNAKLKIIDLFCQFAGGTSNNDIFLESPLMIKLIRGEMEDGVLVANRKYSVHSYLQTPIQKPQNKVQTLYNESLYKTRIIIEQLFEIWKRRFPILSLGINYDIPTTQMIVSACAVLHNIAMEHNEKTFDIDYTGRIKKHSPSDVNRSVFLNHFENLLNNGSSDLE